MDIALNSYLPITTRQDTQVLLQETKLNINDLVLDEFIATLDATPTTKKHIKKA